MGQRCNHNPLAGCSCDDVRLAVLVTSSGARAGFDIALQALEEMLPAARGLLETGHFFGKAAVSELEIRSIAAY